MLYGLPVLEEIRIFQCEGHSFYVQFVPGATRPRDERLHSPHFVYDDVYWLMIRVLFPRFDSLQPCTIYKETESTKDKQECYVLHPRPHHCRIIFESCCEEETEVRVCTYASTFKDRYVAVTPSSLTLMFDGKKC